jgi:hypothetical protein
MICEDEEHRELLKNSALHDILDVEDLAEG